MTVQDELPASRNDERKIYDRNSYTEKIRRVAR